MTKEVLDLLQRHKSLKSGRGIWENHWQELADAMLPRRGDFVTMSVAGEKRTRNIYDGTPLHARRGLATTLNGLLTPRTEQWFFLRAAETDLNERDDVKAWLEDTEQRMHRAIYNRRSRFVQRTGEMYNDLVTFGTGNLFIGEGVGLDRLHFRAFHLKNLIVCENADGEVDTFFVEERLSARQAEQRFGRDNLGEKTREALTQNQPQGSKDRTFPFLWVVMPREDRDMRRRDNRSLPFASIMIDVDSEHRINESGFHEFPMAVPRWDTTAGEIYGRGPGMEALPDAKTLQAQAKSVLRTGQMVAEPPLLAMSESLIRAPQVFPGGITYFEVESAREMGGRMPIEALKTGSNVPLGREMQQDSRALVERAFFRNVFNLPIDGPQMTATEIIERKEEFLREVGPTLGQLEDDGPAQIVERIFGVMKRAGQFAEPPDAIASQELKFEFLSPVEKVRKQIDAMGLPRSIEVMGPLVQVRPDMLDNFDTDEIARDLPEVFSVPKKYIRDEAARDALRQARAQAEQAMEARQIVQEGADVAEKIGRVAGGQAA